MLVSGPWNSFQDTCFGTLPLTQCLSPYVCYVLAFEICGMHQMCHKPVLEVVNRRSIMELCESRRSRARTLRAAGRRLHWSASVLTCLWSAGHSGIHLRDSCFAASSNKAPREPAHGGQEQGSSKLHHAWAY